ncbi:MAG: mucin desulfatase, partial [Deltaproteobacteria bacterium]|nr:mucin desulfatase [Deltaproteobacteria bacterium]
FLKPQEIDRLAFSCKLITFECGIRFLTDYLDGDVYFRTHRAGQNLDRCRVHFRMVSDMERKMDRMLEIIEKHRTEN